MSINDYNLGRIANALEGLLEIEKMFAEKENKPAHPSFCGQTQPHAGHRWAKNGDPRVAMVMHQDCAGHS